MKYYLKKSGKSSRLIAFFSGFASSPSLLSALNTPSDCDIAFFYDYRNLDCDFDFTQYANVSVIAWSFGVWVADFMADKIGSAFSIAVNGSRYPSDNLRGIAVEIFNKTVDTFDEKNMLRFFRRICGGAGEYADLSPFLTDRTAPELKAELEFLRGAFCLEENKSLKWNLSIISKNDKIFAVDNLRRAWSCDIIERDGEHLNIAALNKAFEISATRQSNIKNAFEKNIKNYDEHAFVQREICQTLVDDIKNFASQKFLESISNVLEVGCGTGMLTACLAKDLRNANWCLNDLSAKLCAQSAGKIYGKFSINAGDIRDCVFNEKFDLIISSSCIQWIPNLNSLFKKFHANSSPEAILAFSTFGDKNYMQIKETLGKGLDYSTVEQISIALEKADYNVLYSAEDILDVEFHSPFEVLRHIKSTGVNGGFSEFWTPSKLKNFSGQYSKKYSCNEGVMLSYNPIYIIAQKKF